MERKDFVKSEEIYNLFKASQFVQNLRAAGNHTFRHGGESMFYAARDIDKKFYFSEVTKGESSVTLSGIIDSAEKLIKGITRPNYLFFDFHFHPNNYGPVLPSPTDLTIFTYPEFKNTRGIGQIFKNKNIDMLIIQRKKELHASILGDCVDSYAREAENFASTQECADFFNRSGLFNAEVVSYERVKKYPFYSPLFSATNFKKFSYTLNLEEALDNKFFR